MRFVEWLYLEGELVSGARYAVYSVIFLEDFARRDPSVMPLAKATLRAFVKREPPLSRDPPSLEVVWLLVDQLLALPRTRQTALAAAFVAVAFDGYLRPSEALGLRRRDVTPPLSGAAASRWSLTIAPQGGAPAKNGEFDAGVVVGHHDRGFVVDVLAALYAGAASDDALLFAGLDLPCLERLFRVVSAKLPRPVVPHGLRHAGPSHDAVVHKDKVEDIQTRGRWLAIQSCRHYSKPAALLRGLRSLSSVQLGRASQLMVEGPRLLLAAVSAAMGLRQGQDNLARKAARKPPRSSHAFVKKLVAPVLPVKRSRAKSA